MPPVVLAAGIAGAAALGGAALQSRATNRATKASERATGEALTYTKEQEALARADYEKRLNDFYAARDSLLSRYGVDVPGISHPSSMPAPPAGYQPPMPGAVPRPGPGMPPPQGMPMPGAIPQQASIPETIRARADGSDWNDWERYNLRQA